MIFLRRKQQIKWIKPAELKQHPKKYNLAENPLCVSRWQKPNSSKTSACTQSSFINFSMTSFLFCLQMDWLQPKPKRKTGLILLSHVVSITSLLYKGDSLMVWWSACTVVSAHVSWKEVGLTMPGAKDPALECERRNISKSAVLQKEMSFSAVPTLPGAAAQDAASYLTYTGSLRAP